MYTDFLIPFSQTISVQNLRAFIEIVFHFNIQESHCVKTILNVSEKLPVNHIHLT